MLRYTSLIKVFLQHALFWHFCNRTLYINITQDVVVKTNIVLSPLRSMAQRGRR